MGEVRKYKGKFWNVWKETYDDDSVEISLCHKRYNLFLHTEEFSDLVESVNKSAYGILGKKGLLMGKQSKKDS